MSLHTVNVVEITEIKEHPNADRLEIIPVGGWQCVSGKGNFKVGDKAVYIEPDYVVPLDHPEFEFLQKEGETKKGYRLKARKLRGQISYGLLIPLPKELSDRQVGDNVKKELGIVRYEPKIRVTDADALNFKFWPKNIYCPKFEVEQLRNYKDCIDEGEDVVVTEKIHGANAKFLYTNGTMYAGSRTRWLHLQDETSCPNSYHIWQKVLHNRPEIISWCKANQGKILFGEVYGKVQSLRYGIENDVDFAAFSVLDNGLWWDWGTVQLTCDFYNVPIVPILYKGKYDEEVIFELAEQDSVVPTAPKGHMSEGVVILPQREKRNRCGRVILKHISNRYWEK